MFRSKFQTELDGINFDLIELGRVVNSVIQDCVHSLANNDLELSQQVIEIGHETKAQVEKIEERALKAMLMQQPVARDMRFITTALKVVSNMDRISRQAREICHIVSDLHEMDYKFDAELLKTMGEHAIDMVQNCIESFANLDIDLATKVKHQDDIMDNYFKELKLQMIERIKNKEENADSALYFMMIGKYLEKIGDNSEAIANWTSYCKSGKK
ncbi:MAG: phosphate signaling complex protein PhoU [Firmicutes bacterium]|nr:phosphate signaling complex protein PhoU [Bacillota bacterium]MCL1954144.1 phosphate signaling complex protein PhoU [Bacillota bacterium]